MSSLCVGRERRVTEGRTLQHSREGEEVDKAARHWSYE